MANHTRSNVQDYIRTYFETSIMVGALLALTTSLTQAQSLSSVTRREAVADGAALSVEVRPDQARPGVRWLEMTVRNTSEKDFLLLGGEHRNGLEFHLTTEDGRVLLDRSPVPAQDYLLKAGGNLTRRIDLSAQPLYFPNQGFLQQIVEINGLGDAALEPETHLYLHVSLRGDGQILTVDPIPVALRSEDEVRARRNFLRLHGDVETKIWDPTLPVQPAPAFTPGVVLVSFRPEVTREDAERLVATRGFLVRNDLLFRAPTYMLSVEVPEGTEFEALEAFRSSRAVVEAKVEQIFTIL